MIGPPEENSRPAGDLQKLEEDALELIVLAGNDLRAAEARFNDIDFNRQLQLARAVEGDDRKELLYLKNDCTDLVQALEPEEVRRTVALVGPEDALGLLGAATPEQIVHILDVECWHDGQLAPKQVLYWLEIILQLADEELSRIIPGLDTQLLAAMLLPWVKQSEDPDAPLDVRTSSHYAVTPGSIQVEDPVASAFLAQVFAADEQLFSGITREILLEQARAAEVYADREERLERRGFPSEADVRQIYVEVPLADLFTPHQPAEETQPAAPEDKPFLNRAIETAIKRRILEPGSAAKWQKALVNLANKVVVADGIDTSEPHGLELATEVAASYTGLGLEYMSSGIEAIAAEKLGEFDLDFLFRVGHTLLCELRRKLWRDLSGFDLDNLALRLEPPHSEVLQAIHRSRPMIPVEGRHGLVRLIRSSAEIDYIERVIEEIGDIALLHEDVLPLWPATPTADEIAPVPTFGQLSATVAASAIVGKLPPGPLSPSEAHELWTAFREESAEAEELALGWLDMLLGQAGWIERPVAMARRFWREQIAAMRDELAGAHNPPSTDELVRMQSFLVINPRQPAAD